MSLIIVDPTRSSARRIGRPTIEGKTESSNWFLQLGWDTDYNKPCSGKLDPAYPTFTNCAREIRVDFKSFEEELTPVPLSTTSGTPGSI